MTTARAGDHASLARSLVTELETTVDRAVARLAAACTDEGRVSPDLLDRQQAIAYDLATLSSATVASRALVGLADRDEVAASTALVFAAEVAADARARLCGREARLGLPTPLLDDASEAIVAGRDPDLHTTLGAHVLASGASGGGELSEELEFVRGTFRRFTEERVVPVAQQAHRDDADVPEEIIAGVAALGGYGLTIPEAYGGTSTGPGDLHAMLLATEELSRGSLGLAGSLITRPEIVAAALLGGGTEEQKHRWLPAIASGERMCAVAVTEPDAGSDVGAVSCVARWDDGQWVLDGVKTWCTFAGRADQLMVLARTDPDTSRRARGLSLFIVDKPAVAGKRFEVAGPLGGRIVGRAIPTLGYRGLHSFEVSFEGCRVPADALVGGEDGLGRGFALQMDGFAAARLQTTARAQGVMQAAIDLTRTHVRDRYVFSTRLGDLQLTRTKLARMAASLAACRALSAAVAPLLAERDPGAPLAAAQAKQVACRAAEWVTREAQQLHGGYGYGEEHPVSRLFVDARVLSIFEGADEVLALRVIARGLCADALVTQRGSAP